jgi:hypothetical protein
MSADFIFISHASSDDAFVTQLRQALEGQGLSVWVDSRSLRSGAKLAPEIAQAIEQARQVLVVLSPETVNAAWVRKDIQQALQVEQRRKGTRRVAGTATLRYEPASATAPEVESRRYNFTAPLGPIEAEDLRWYLESYYLWPVGVFAERAKWIEVQLPKWGQQLYAAARGAKLAQAALAEDTALDFDDAVELLLLLERGAVRVPSGCGGVRASGEANIGMRQIITA